MVAPEDFAGPNFEELAIQIPEAQMMPDQIGLLPQMQDFPSLRDLETSNVFSGVNHNFNI